MVDNSYLTNKDAQRGAEALVAFFAQQGLALTPDQEQLSTRAFDHSFESVMDPTPPHGCPVANPPML